MTEFDTEETLDLHLVYERLREIAIRSSETLAPGVESRFFCFVKIVSLNQMTP